ncbi:hypothetical protein ABH944_004817 [Caballeronia udeis]|uniref:Peptidase n=1 Tax=Caballeronia udeis TaxID=1232866 RepID=A0ABW8MLW3_9BURK
MTTPSTPDLAVSVASEQEWFEAHRQRLALMPMDALVHAVWMAALSTAPTTGSAPEAQILADESNGAWAAFEKSTHAEMSNQEDLWHVWQDAWDAKSDSPAASVPHPSVVASLLKRIDSAIDRITSGSSLMRVPAEDTDPDLVLAECRALLSAQGAKGE